MGRRFRPRLFTSLLAALVFPGLLALGFWQLDRAGQKQQLQQQYQQRSAVPPVNLALATADRQDAGVMLWRRATLQGSYDTSTVFLLDNQTLAGRAGNLIFARFLLADGSAVLVNHGWVPLPAERTRAPEFTLPGAQATVSGVVKAPPRTVLLGQHVPEQLGHGIVRLQELDIAWIAGRYDWQLLPYVVRLDPPAPAGIQRIWQEPGFGRERHLGYAFQWFALAAALVIIYLLVNIRRE